jgi:hypothetical protein
MFKIKYKTKNGELKVFETEAVSAKDALSQFLKNHGELEVISVTGPYSV